VRRNPSAVIPIDTARFAWPRLSPDGKRVLLEMQTGPVTWDIWVYDIAAHTVSRLTSGFTGIRPSGWTADGRSVVFIANDSATPDALRSVVSQPWDGSSAPHELFRLPLDIHDVTIGPPHGYAAFTVNAFDVWITPVDTPQAARPLVVTAAFDGHPRLTRDGTLLAYSSGETGRPEVYVRPVLGPASRLQVSVAAGWQPVWSADGHYLYYRAPGYMMRATIGRGSLRVTRRDTLFRDDFAQHNTTNYDVFPDGKELLMIRQSPTRVHAGVILNWPELLRQRAAQRF
jgi:eukaryotic-like serine/threonine-protein kinase